VATAVLASLVPALQAAADEPADAVRRGPSGGRRLFQFFQAGASLTLVGCGLVLVFTRDYLPTRVGGYGGMFAMFIGLLLAVPVLVGWIARILLPIARRVFGVEARLAADNLLRAPGRTGVVVGALAAGVALMTLTAGVCTSSERPIVDWLRRSLTADIFVLAGGKENLTSLVLPMAPTTADEIRAMPGVEHVVGMRFTQPEYNGRIAYLIACDAEVYLKSHRARDAAPHIGKFQYLSRPGMALISENFAALNRLKVNDTLSLRGPKGPVQLQVAGIIPEYSWSRGSILVDRAWYAREYDDPLLDLCHVFAAPGREDEVRRQVEEFCGRRALFPFSRSELDSYLNDVIRRVYQLAYLQQVVVAIVAALGVVMALLISVLQRRRELGLLRAVGATSGQVLYSVLAEAALMGIFGTILGIAAGIPLEWYVLRVLILEESGFLFPLLVPWREVLVIGVVAVVAATLAGLMPAVRASRLEIAAAVAYE
jgi:putative ABC transport system permease protein